MATNRPIIEVHKVGRIYYYHIEQDGMVVAFTIDEDTFIRLRLAEEMASSKNEAPLPRVANGEFEIR